MVNGKAIIGLMGGVGSGKSCVAGEFLRLGCGVVDADRVGHDLLGAGHIKDKIREVFGEGVFGADGEVDRGALSEIVFHSEENVARINNILHPEILVKCEQLIDDLSITAAKAIILDMPLLVEVGWDKRCDFLVFIDCPEQIRAQRAEKKGTDTKKNLKKRENFQISLDTKAKIAHYTLNNHSDRQALASQVDRIFSIINK